MLNPNPQAIEVGRVLVVLAGCLASWLFGVLCGAVAVIDIDFRQPMARDNRPRAYHPAPPTSLPSAPPPIV